MQKVEKLLGASGLRSHLETGGYALVTQYVQLSGRGSQQKC
jgi:hypothetical protein